VEAVSTELVQWLTEILAEDEAAAVPNRVIISGGSPGLSVPNCIADDVRCGWRLEGAVVPPGERPVEWQQAIHEHNLTHLTAGQRATLARIAADRLILDRLAALEADERLLWDDYSDWVNGTAPRDRPSVQSTETERQEIPGLRMAVRLITSAYADRPGYQEAWKL
jgi:uncharacterized protein DUF6221